MEVSRDEYEVHGPNGGSDWYASEGIGENGQSVSINYIASDQREVTALAHGLGIAHNVHMHKKAQRIGTAAEYREFSD